MFRGWFKGSSTTSTKPISKPNSKAAEDAEEKRRTEAVCHALATIPVGTLLDLASPASPELPDPTKAQSIALLGGGGFSKVELVSLNCHQGPRLFARRSMKTTSQYDVKEFEAEKKALQVARGSPFLLQEFMSYEDHTSARPLKMITELLPNGDLRSLLKRYQQTYRRARGFLEQDARFFMACLVLGLEHLHKRSFAHRDIKPDNILLTADNYAVLGDFGAASEAWQCSFSGTPAYTAPEYYSYDSTKALSVKTDIWSLGVTLYQLVAGRLPDWARPGENHTRSPRALCYEGRLRLPAYFSKELKDLLRRMLALEPRMRPSVFEVRVHPWFSGLNWPRLAGGALPGPLPDMHIKLLGSSDSRSWRFALGALHPGNVLHRCAALQRRTRTTMRDVRISKDCDNAPESSEPLPLPLRGVRTEGEDVLVLGDWLLPAGAHGPVGSTPALWASHYGLPTPGEPSDVNHHSVVGPNGAICRPGSIPTLLWALGTSQTWAEGPEGSHAMSGWSGEEQDAGESWEGDEPGPPQEEKAKGGDYILLCPRGIQLETPQGLPQHPVEQGLPVLPEGGSGTSDASETSEMPRGGESYILGVQQQQQQQHHHSYQHSSGTATTESADAVKTRPGLWQFPRLQPREVARAQQPESVQDEEEGMGELAAGQAAERQPGPGARLTLGSLQAETWRASEQRVASWLAQQLVAPLNTQEGSHSTTSQLAPAGSLGSLSSQAAISSVIKPLRFNLPQPSQPRQVPSSEAGLSGASWKSLFTPIPGTVRS